LIVLNSIPLGRLPETNRIRKTTGAEFQRRPLVVAFIGGCADAISVTTRGKSRFGLWGIEAVQVAVLCGSSRMVYVLRGFRHAQYVLRDADQIEYRKRRHGGDVMAKLLTVPVSGYEDGQLLAHRPRQR
jgi:hypothetical protein